MEKERLMEGRQLGHYLLTEKIGEGGMGAVYKARDLRLDRTVAIKVLSISRSSDPDPRRRFLKEARSASSLNHPNIVTLHAIESEDGVDYIVMEYVPGSTLNEMIQPTGLPLLEALKYAEQIARAAETAHAAGIIHRDLKPANVVVKPTGEVKVLDFGLAKLMGEAAEKDTTASIPLTQTGVMMGTVFYMSPEQAVGDAIDQRSDIFSLGVILYEMLAGKRPFSGVHTAAVVHAIYYEPHLPVARRDIPEAVAAVLNKALQKNPADRYGSMREFSADLAAIIQALESNRLPAPRPKTPKRISTRAVRIGAGLAIAAALGTAVWKLVPQMSTGSIASIPPHELVAQGRKLLLRYDLPANIDKAIETFNAAISANAEYAPAHAALAMALVRKNTNKEQPGLLDQALQHAQRAQSLDPQLAMARTALGYCYAAQRKYPEALTHLNEALNLDPSNAEALISRGNLHYRLRDYPKAEADCSAAVRLQPEWFESRLAIGVVYYQTGRYKEAEAEYKEAVRLAPDSARAYQMLGAMYHMQGRFDEAAREFQKSLEIRPTPSIYSNLGTIYFFRGMYAQAAASFQKATELDPSSHLYWGNLGDALRWTPGNREKSAPAYDRAIQRVREALGKNPDDLELRSRLAVYLAKRGDSVSASSELDRVDQATGSKGGPLYYRCVVASEVANQRERSLRYLKAALDQNYSKDEIFKDPELEKLRTDSRFQTLIRAARKQ